MGESIAEVAAGLSAQKPSAWSTCESWISAAVVPTS